MSAQRERFVLRERQRVAQLQRENMQQQLKRWVADNEAHAYMLASQKHSKYRWILRWRQEQEENQRREDALNRRKEERRCMKQQREQEERIAHEMEQMKIEELRDKKIRQRIRESSLELRELEVKLKEADTAWERAAQIAEKKASLLEHVVREQAEQHAIEQEEEACQALIREEREKLLHEHGQSLCGFLPKIWSWKCCRKKNRGRRRG
uniref:Trichoplein keratin filament-binding protein n=1 Tax=Eptatretus burgeri TaxID=7764 RepID=A0A8C4QLI1_EPTBU